MKVGYLKSKRAIVLPQQVENAAFITYSNGAETERLFSLPMSHTSSSSR
jgi:hypothetical protein